MEAGSEEGFSPLAEEPSVPSSSLAAGVFRKSVSDRSGRPSQAAAAGIAWNRKRVNVQKRARNRRIFFRTGCDIIGYSS